jgi:hypothetical protein
VDVVVGWAGTAGSRDAVVAPVEDGDGLRGDSSDRDWTGCAAWAESAIRRSTGTGDCRLQEVQVVLRLLAIQRDHRSAVGKDHEAFGLVKFLRELPHGVDADRFVSRPAFADADDHRRLVGQQVDPPVRAEREVAHVLQHLGGLGGQQPVPLGHRRRENRAMAVSALLVSMVAVEATRWRELCERFGSEQRAVS